MSGVRDGACRAERRPVPELDRGDRRSADARQPAASNPPDSWSTGTNPAVNSHYLRILAANPAIKGKIYNFTGQETDLTAEAKEGRRETSGLRDGRTDRGQHVRRDASPAKVGAKLEATLRILTAGLPNARLFVTSTRDVARLILQVLDQNRDLRGFPVCGCRWSERRGACTTASAVRRGQQSAGARSVPAHRQCRFDGNTVFKMPLTLADISTTDHFSLSAKGHRKLAEVTWKVTFPFGR